MFSNIFDHDMIVRNDGRGDGRYGAGRVSGSRRYRHKGTDYECFPGEKIFSPIDGAYLKPVIVYPDTGAYYGVEIEGMMCNIRMLYVMPLDSLIGKPVQAGEIIGFAQDIGKRYVGCHPHIHVEVTRVDPELVRRA